MNALLIIDLQNDFMPTGVLPAKDAFAIIPIANALMPHFDFILATQDWHPAHHGSFASSYPGKKPGDTIILGGVSQVLWVDHCVQNSHGADFAPGLDTKEVHQVIRKGTDPNIDSYSAFFDNAQLRSTGLAQILKDKKVTDVYIIGVATDYCVKFSALDAVALGFITHVIIDACRGVDLSPGDSRRALDEMKNAGAKLLSCKDALGQKGK